RDAAIGGDVDADGLVVRGAADVGSPREAGVDRQWFATAPVARDEADVVVDQHARDVLRSAIRAGPSHRHRLAQDADRRLDLHPAVGLRDHGAATAHAQARATEIGARLHFEVVLEESIAVAHDDVDAGPSLDITDGLVADRIPHPAPRIVAEQEVVAAR